MEKLEEVMTNTEKFTGKAVDYDKYRPSYPQALYEDIFLKASLRKSISRLEYS